jgi:hypothetical protein
LKVARAAILCLLATERAALAWGPLGHRVASNLAASRLTAAAANEVKAILEPGETLADASIWADTHRRALPESGPWHYVNVPITEPGYDDRFCPPAGCIVSKIVEFRRTLADRHRPRAERQLALRFLLHLIEDLHQPVHVGDRSDRGGNDLELQFFERGTNLHRLWDVDVIEYRALGEAEWLADLQALLAERSSPTWTRGTPQDWASESFLAAKRAYLVPGTDVMLAPGMLLGRAYYDSALPVVRVRLAQAGARLAATLNGVFP